MIWWASQPSRGRSERSAIADLEDSSVWLSAVAWRFDKQMRLVVDFKIEHLDRVYALSMTYPNVFPDVPPQVRPQDSTRLTGHQYGAGGELCLEFRPENWDTAYTGAMMIESAHRLLVGETPSEGVTADVENAHRTTVAQAVRTSRMRCLVEPSIAETMSLLPVGVVTEFVLGEHRRANHWLAAVHRIGPEDSPVWTCGPDVPAFSRRSGFAVRLGPDPLVYPLPNHARLTALAASIGDERLSVLLESSTEEAVLLLECCGETQIMWLAPGAGERTVIAYSIVPVPTYADRLPREYDRLAETSVAIVGCGSVGSKIAMMLTRAGVGRFVLVDGDVLFPANLVRNDLDWCSVGLNKPDAVERRMREIRASVQVQSHQMVLGGQESSSLTELAMTSMSKCDLIVDATADAQIYNLCASIARNDRKLLVWGEVFGGGIGGLLMRLRPEVDPVPHAARRQLLEWCADHGRVPPSGDTDHYGVTLEDGSPPLIADDADVTVIASHMARFALDALARENSVFPSSAYAVGLKAEWIFAAPFDSYPIDLLPEGTWGPKQDESLDDELMALVSELFPSVRSDATE